MEPSNVLPPKILLPSGDRQAATRIYRPRRVYVGAAERDYTSIEEW